jgi:DNA mismatch repair protein MutL
VHPTKTEVKFENESSLYAILNSSVRHSLGKFNIIPNIDFSNDREKIRRIIKKKNRETIN